METGKAVKFICTIVGALSLSAFAPASSLEGIVKLISTPPAEIKSVALVQKSVPQVPKSLPLVQVSSTLKTEKDYQKGPAFEHCIDGNVSFSRWLKDVKQDAVDAGISRRSLKLLNGLTPDPKVLRADRAQGIFNTNFLDFSSKLVSNNRLKVGKRLLKKYKNVFDEAEAQFGVPGPVIAAFWALESDFGGYLGNFNTIRSLVTLAYDCRRPGLFRPQIVDALKLVDRGDVRVNQLKGAWAGELGQTQFLPSDYLDKAIDFDGDGKRDLINSEVDVIGSSARMVGDIGWRRDEPWIVEVQVPNQLDWSLSSLDTTLKASDWGRLGVTKIDGSSLEHGDLDAILLLPMGHRGPAFLGYPNFNVYLEWNQSMVYTLTAAYLATRFTGADKVQPQAGTKIAVNEKQVKRLQTILSKRGHDVGGIDGTIGSLTREAVRQEQIRLGYPVDGYPTKRLIRDLAANR